jgi:hypothetical protein
MSEKSYSTTFSVDKTPAEVVEAIADVRGWWSKDVEGPTDKQGEEFYYHTGDSHKCNIKVTELVPGQKVSWLVVKNFFDFTEDSTEWTGTTMDFEVTGGDDGSEVRFTHNGLVPTYECYDVCTGGWDFYIGKSLPEFIETGSRQPAGD